MIDTHCHVNFDSYDADRAAMLARAVAADVTQIIIPAIDVETSGLIADMIAADDRLYGAVGIHPNSSADFNAAMIETLEALTGRAKIVAIGEIGLDYYRDSSPKAAQFAALEAQLALAAKIGLPVIIHNREASADLIDILEAWAHDLPPALAGRPGVMHSFSAPPEIAERALTVGFYLGFTGPITYKNADALRQIAAAVPLDRLLVETDGPFLPPTPHRGQRNEPAYIPLIVDRLAALKGIAVEQVAQATTENARRLFSIPSLPAAH